MKVDISALSSPYIAHVGFVTTPRYFDDAIQEFLRVAPEGIGAIQRVMALDGYSFELSDRADGMWEMERSALALAESNCEVVAQVGTNWVHAAGTTPAAIESSIARISDSIGARFLMAGTCIIDGLVELGARRIAVANSYYRDDWRDGINGFLEEAGFEIAWSGSIMDQGIVSSLEEAKAIEAATHWNYPAEIVAEAVKSAFRTAPNVDAVVQTGAGFRTVGLLAEIEDDIGVPVVASDASTFWKILGVLQLAARPGHGQLLDSTRG